MNPSEKQPKMPKGARRESNKGAPGMEREDGPEEQQSEDGMGNPEGHDPAQSGNGPFDDGKALGPEQDGQLGNGPTPGSGRDGVVDDGLARPPGKAARQGWNARCEAWSDSDLAACGNGGYAAAETQAPCLVLEPGNPEVGWAAALVSPGRGSSARAVRRPGNRRPAHRRQYHRPGDAPPWMCIGDCCEKCQVTQSAAQQSKHWLPHGRGRAARGALRRIGLMLLSRRVEHRGAKCQRRTNPEPDRRHQPGFSPLESGLDEYAGGLATPGQRLPDRFTRWRASREPIQQRRHSLMTTA